MNENSQNTINQLITKINTILHPQSRTSSGIKWFRSIISIKIQIKIIFKQLLTKIYFSKKLYKMDFIYNFIALANYSINTSQMLMIYT